MALVIFSVLVKLSGLSLSYLLNSPDYQPLWSGTSSNDAHHLIATVCNYFNPIQKALVMWSDDLEKQSAGRLKLRIYPAGQLGGGPNRQFDAARNGVVDMAFSLHGATPGRYPMTELASLPFAAPSAGNKSTGTSRRRPKAHFTSSSP